MRTLWLSLSVVVAVGVLLLLAVVGSATAGVPLSRFLATWLLDFAISGAVMGGGYAAGHWWQARQHRSTTAARS